MVMRIAFVIASLNSGGAERVIANLANCFVSQKDEIDLILFNDTIYYELDKRVRVHIIKEDKRGSAIYWMLRAVFVKNLRKLPRKL